jgi:hypothetical protein
VPRRLTERKDVDTRAEAAHPARQEGCQKRATSSVKALVQHPMESDDDGPNIVGQESVTVA